MVRLENYAPGGPGTSPQPFLLATTFLLTMLTWVGWVGTLALLVLPAFCGSTVWGCACCVTGAVLHHFYKTVYHVVPTDMTFVPCAGMSSFAVCHCPLTNIAMAVQQHFCNGRGTMILFRRMQQQVGNWAFAFSRILPGCCTCAQSTHRHLPRRAEQQQAALSNSLLMQQLQTSKSTHPSPASHAPYSDRGSKVPRRIVTRDVG